jgi:hypothetical protein
VFQVSIWVIESLVLPSAMRNCTGIPAILRGGEDEQQLLEVRPVVFRISEDDPCRALSAHCLGLHSVLTAKADCRRVVVQLLELHPEALADREHDGGEQRAAVGIIEPIERSAEPIIAQMPEVLLCQAVHGRGESVHGLDLAVDRLALDHDRAQQHSKRRGVRHSAASIGSRYVLIEQLDQPEP